MLSASLEAMARVALVSVCAYAGLILILRIAGKRSLAKLNAFDLVITVAFGSTLATILLSKDVSLAEGLVAFVMLALLQYAVTKGSIHWPWLKRLVRSSPRLLVDQGRFLESVMAEERVTRGEVEAAIRKRGIGRVEEVAAVVLETDGSFSVVRAEGGDEELTALRSVKREEGA